MSYRNKRIRMLLIGVPLFICLFLFFNYMEWGIILLLPTLLILFYRFISPFVQVFIDEVELKVVKHYSFFKKVKSIPLLKCKKAEVILKEKDQVILRYQLKGKQVKRIRISSLKASTSSSENIEALNQLLKQNMVLQLNQARGKTPG